MAIMFRAMRPIDPDTEEIITLSRAARGVKPDGVSPATFARWLQWGVRISGSEERVKPATIRIGGRRLTSVEAMRDFFTAQNATDSPAPQFTPTQRQRMANTANLACEAAGL